MPIPSFTDTLGGSLGSGISIVHDGGIFPGDDADGLDITKMNAELAATTRSGDVEFLPTEEPADIPFKRFLESRHQESKKLQLQAK